MIVKICDHFDYWNQTIDLGEVCRIYGKKERFNVARKNEKGEPYMEVCTVDLYPAGKATKLCNLICHAIYWGICEDDADEITEFIAEHNQKLLVKWNKAREKYGV